MGSRTDNLSSQNSHVNLSMSFKKPKTDTCYIIGRGIAQYSGIALATISLVSFVTSGIFACIALSNIHIPPICFIAGVISLSTLGISILSLVASGISGATYAFFNDKIKKLNNQFITP